MKMKQFLMAASVFISMTAMSQPTDHWRLYVNKTKIQTGQADVPGEAAISSAAKGRFTVRYSGTGKNDSKRTILIFDQERHELMSKAIGDSYGRFSFNIDSLKSKTQTRAFSIYTVAIPKNRNTAMLVRVAPKLLCAVSWKQAE